ncbi:energy-coupling factor transporter transmembrane component T family protein [Saccharibacillus alkalitolerans]|uniref:Energy-coupling factor transporter transmembrane protein EcfT n=1 Tax=Saccharibacillus alkalitolerans TaxID=2705290 RepID=A0ABX0F708_9BACL|nr:energy-coupling factor transporter transmembrane component T [Saccharibacillus alkalitolerans]NGZ76741.1 energy-coupling factor transporter transmembrane protein EcfT [Saccharibacillus alkalitolerans]
MKRFFEPSRRTWLHRANPAVKLALFVLLFVVTMLTHRIDASFYLACVFLLLLFAASGYPIWKTALLASGFALAFASASLTMILFGKGSEIWWSFGPVAISKESFYRGLHLGFRSIAFGCQGLLFVLTTSSTGLFYALMQRLKLSPKYAYSFMASLRLMPMALEELRIRRDALAVRGSGSGSRAGALLRLPERYALPLLAQSIRRAQRTAAAMEVKRFDAGSRRTYYYSSPVTRSDAAALLLLAGATAAALLLAQALPVFNLGDMRMVP